MRRLFYQVDRPTLYAYIAQKIRDRREELGLTRTQVYTRLGISRMAWYNIEVGSNMPHIDRLCQIAYELGIPLRELLPEEPPMRKIEPEIGPIYKVIGPGTPPPS